MAQPLQPFDPGRTKACCDVFTRLEASVCTILNSSDDSSVIEKIQALAQSSTPESPLQNNVPIYNILSKRTHASVPTTLSHYQRRIRHQLQVTRAACPSGLRTEGRCPRGCGHAVTSLRASTLIYWSTFSVRKEPNSWFMVKATTPECQLINSPKSL